MSNKINKWHIIAGISAVSAYRFYKGKGVFNKLRYKEQHEAVSGYIGTHYPNAFYSEITPTEEGWSCVISEKGRKILLYMTKTDDGIFVFWEKEM